MERRERHELWLAMAELFLDSDTRDQLPALAGLCVRSGLTAAEARHVWRYEVTPALWPNLYAVVGEWGCWPRQWLLEKLERRQAPAQPGWWDALCYHASAWSLEPMWRAVEQCMAPLAALPPAEATRLEATLTWLARVFFDFIPGARPADPALHTVYEATFLPIFAPLAVNNRTTGESPARCRGRVEGALSVTGRAGGAPPSR